MSEPRKVFLPEIVVIFTPVIGPQRNTTCIADIRPENDKPFDSYSEATGWLFPEMQAQKKACESKYAQSNFTLWGSIEVLVTDDED